MTTVAPASAARPGARVVVIENLVDHTPSMRFTTATGLLLLDVGGAGHARRSMTDRPTDAGPVIGEVRPVDACPHAVECAAPADPYRTGRGHPPGAAGSATYAGPAAPGVFRAGAQEPAPRSQW